MTTKMIESLIDKKKVEINKLANEISDLMDKLVFQDEGFKEIDSIIKIKTGRKKSDSKEIPIKEGRKYWTEDFVDEDNGEVISIERSELVAINGKRVDRLGRPVKVYAQLVEISSEKKAWEN